MIRLGVARPDGPRFAGDMLFWDPSDCLQRETVEVWIDANDPSRYDLDTTFLPKHAGA